MLEQNLESKSTPEQSAGQIRVKKEEFARAIAALEARRQSEAQAKEGTVIIGDVLQQLQIDLPAEEVLQEIEQMHSGQPREEVNRQPFWNADRKSATPLLTGMALVPLATICVAILILNWFRFPPTGVPSNYFSSNTTPSQAASSQTHAGSVYAPTMMRPFHTLPGMTPVLMDESGFNASSVLKPLSAISDNQPVHCTTGSFAQLCNTFLDKYKPQGYLNPTDGLDPGQLNPIILARSTQIFDVRPQLKKPWILVKHNGKLYLRAWVAAKFTAAQSKGHAITLHSSPLTFDVGVVPYQITLPLSVSVYSPLGSGFGKATPDMLVGNISLDGHAWEKW